MWVLRKSYSIVWSKWNKWKTKHSLKLFLISWLMFSSVWLLSCVWFSATPWTAACQASLSINNSRSLLKLMSIKSVMPFNHSFLCHLLLLLSIFPSIRVFYNEEVLHIKWPKFWIFSFSISTSNEYSGLISLSMDWLDLLVVQGNSQESSPRTTVQKYHFFVTQLSYVANNIYM